MISPFGAWDARFSAVLARLPFIDDSANPNHRDNSTFSLQFCNLSPYAVQEILDLSEAQAERFFKAFDVTKLAMERLKIWPMDDTGRLQAIEVDEMDSGHPNMTLNMLYDIVAEIAAVTEGAGAEPFLDTKAFRDKRKELHQIIGAANCPKNVISWRALQGKLGKIRRLKIFDSNSSKPLDFRKMLTPGRVTIIDLSDTDSPQINNLVIAQLLYGVQRQQEENYQRAMREEST